MSASGYQAYPDPAHGTYGAASNAPVNAAAAPGAGANAGYQGQYHQSAYPSSHGAAGGASVGPSVISPYSPNLSPHFSGTTVMLIILALVSLMEGTMRVIQSSTGQDGTSFTGTSDNFPRAATLAGGLWESLYSFATLFVALWALLFDWHSIVLTTLALLLQLGGWYTVVVFAIAQPSYWRHQNFDPYYGNNGAENTLNAALFSSDQSRALYVFGWILSLLAVNTAILSGMMFFTIQLMQIQSNKVDELHSPHYYGRRLGWWSLLQIVLGFSQIIFGALEVDKNTGHQLTNNSAILFYPNVTTYPSIILVTGIIFFLTGIVGWICACVNNLHLSNFYIGWSWLFFWYIVGAHVMTTCGIVFTGNNLVGYGLSELGVYFGTLLIPMWLAYKAATIETVERGYYSYGPAQNYANRPMVV